MLERFIRVHQNPWSHTVPDDKLAEIIHAVADGRTQHVVKQFEAGQYSRNSLGMAILNPAAPMWQPSSETLLATIAIGPEGERFVTNAIAKAVEHRDRGLLAGYGVYVDLTQSSDGDFCYGYSTQVDGTIGGASGQTELQDAMEAGHALVSFNYWIRLARKNWLDGRKEHPHWFCDRDEPGGLYSEMANRPGQVHGRYI